MFQNVWGLKENEDVKVHYPSIVVHLLLSGGVAVGHLPIQLELNLSKIEKLPDLPRLLFIPAFLLGLSSDFKAKNLEPTSLQRWKDCQFKKKSDVNS